MSDLAVAGAETTMVMEKNHKAGVCKSFGERFDPLLFDASVAMGHGDGGVRLLGGAVRNEQPSAQHRAAVGAELDISPLDHRISPLDQHALS